MAGKGKRMRPHTLTTPKPLIKLGGKTIVERIVEGLSELCGETISDIGFVVAPDFGKEVEEQLILSAKKTGARGHIFYQEEALGTAHAVYCAEPLLDGKILIAFADTLFRAKPMQIKDADGVILVNEVEDPSLFGVVKLNQNGVVTGFIEKPQTPVSRLAIVGIYYFKEGRIVRDAIKYLLDNNLKEKGEFQLTNALENLKNKGSVFLTEKLEEWMDCGNKEITLKTHRRILELDEKNLKLSSSSGQIIQSVIIPPCYIGKNAVIQNSVVGPYVSIGEGCHIQSSVIRDSIIGDGSKVQDYVMENSMLGEYAVLHKKPEILSVSAYSSVLA